MLEIMNTQQIVNSPSNQELWKAAISNAGAVIVGLSLGWELDKTKIVKPFNGNANEGMTRFLKIPDADMDLSYWESLLAFHVAGAVARQIASVLPATTHATTEGSILLFGCGVCSDGWLLNDNIIEAARHVIEMRQYDSNSLAAGKESGEVVDVSLDDALDAITEAEMEAESIVADNWRKCIRVARALLEKPSGELTAAQVRKLIGQVKVQTLPPLV